MTSLPHALSRYFTSPVRRRGADYYRGGRVRIDYASASHVAASVLGTVRYKVELRRHEGQMRVFCSCPHFDVEECKHIWATVLAAGERGLLRGDGAHDQLVVVPGAAGSGRMGTQDPGGEEGFDAEREPTGSDERVADVSPTAHPRIDTPPDWRRHLARLRMPPPAEIEPRDPWPSTRELLYVVDAAASDGRGARLDIYYRDRKRDGTWAKPRSRYLPRRLLDHAPDACDRRALALLSGAAAVYGDYDYGYAETHVPQLPFRYRLQGAQLELFLPAACGTGRCLLRLNASDDPQAWQRLQWDAGEPWRFELAARRVGERYEVAGVLRRGAESMELAAPALLLEGGILFADQRAMRYDHGGAFGWIALLREQGVLSVPATQADEFAAELLLQPQLPPLELPEELRYEQVAAVPRPRLAVKPRRDEAWYLRERVQAELGFDYDGTVVARGAPVRGIVQKAERRILLRDTAAERAAEEQLIELGFRAVPSFTGAPTGPLELAANRLPAAVHALVAADWHVEAEGKPYRSATSLDVRASSGVDWFELHGNMAFGGASAQLPELLAAVRRGERMIELDDGSLGLLPEAWLEKYGLLADLGKVHEDHVRFTRSQLGLLDALLAAEPEVRCDEEFEEARAELARFGGVRPAEPPRGFRGELRPYQKEGLGWLGFLREFRFGGCLADDMGLGKTVQVLALLAARRERHAGTDGSEAPPGPSLVVVPKSLVFNWSQEAERFAPDLRVLDHTGPARLKTVGHFADYDLILTTYGTLRNDIARLKDVRFDYVILDEAQAIKNPASAAAKAVRLLKPTHRLALSGTPIENHLGELWSLFEFLNPGMLGTAEVFRRTRAVERSPDEETRKLLARALRPFLLRRTKEQVLPDLPPKVEQTLYCEVEGKQRKLYDELRDHYRGALLERIERDGIGRSKLDILEALLRLRQAANHPGLIDPHRAHEPSAKLEVLLPRLLEVLDEGHKALVFSQFTSLLAILRDRLDRLGLPYAYLDGKTKQREACVARFQTDPECRLFLLSLKAGGVGLNLTAAQYVFVLDPWWNPAVEAQAIDRTHRIGQDSPVFAYRLIARDTIEERVLELQNAKRDLADAIIGADNALIRGLRKEDLELLLG